ncbi:MAG: hypothetical protein [Caudoviricetes sp.]|nr:MAG: hypothetical protein [Caudoviricetes sp.]
MDQNKNILEILENFQTVINENPISDLGASIGNKISNGITNTKSAMGSRKATGEATRNKLANTMTDSWYNWLGQTNSVGNIDDLREFLMLKVGFNNEEAQQLIQNEFGENGNILNRDQQPEQNNSTETNDTEENNDTSDSNENNNGDNSGNSGEDNNQPTQNFSAENPPDNTQKEKEAIKAADEIVNAISAKARNNDINTLDINDVLDKCKETRKIIGKPDEEISNLTRLYAANKILDGYYAISSYNDANNTLSDTQEDSLKDVIARTENFVAKLKNFINKSSNDSTEENSHNEEPVTNQSTTANDNQRNESINEDEILNNDGALPKKTILKFFKDAAAFAYKYNLVGKKRNKTPYGVPVSYGNTSQNQNSSNSSANTQYRGSGQNYVPQDEQEKDEKRFNRRLDKTWDRAETLGISSDEIQNIKALALDNKFQNISNKDDRDALAAIGWSFLRSIR